MLKVNLLVWQRGGCLSRSSFHGTISLGLRKLFNVTCLTCVWQCVLILWEFFPWVVWFPYWLLIYKDRIAFDLEARSLGIVHLLFFIRPCHYAESLSTRLTSGGLLIFRVKSLHVQVQAKAQLLWVNRIRMDSFYSSDISRGPRNLFNVTCPVLIFLEFVPWHESCCFHTGFSYIRMGSRLTLRHTHLVLYIRFLVGHAESLSTRLTSWGHRVESVYSSDISLGPRNLFDLNGGGA